MNAVNAMTQERWDAMTPAQKNAVRDLSGLTEQLVGLEGSRVEVIDAPGDRPRRFTVGRSTGWRPCHLELASARSTGGGSARQAYAKVRRVDRVR